MYVPDGWEEGKVSDLVKSLDAGVSVNSEDKRPERGQYSVLKTSCVSAGIFNKNERKVVLDVNEIARLRESVKGNTIIISRMNTPALVGANAYVAESLENTYLPDRLWQIKPRKNSINMLWFGLWLGSKHTRYLLSNLATGTSGTMKNITKPDVLSIRINIPPLPEQQKIAQILSTWDKAIEKLESLIAVKQKRKKALMQQLLTGKKRFAGFGGEWMESKLGDISFKVTDGVHATPVYQENGIPFISTNNLVPFGNKFNFDSYTKFVSKNDHFELVKRCKPETGDLLVSKCGTIGRTQLIRQAIEFSIFVGLALVKINPLKINPEFLEQLMNSAFYQRQMLSLAPGGTRATLTIGGLKELKLYMPTEIEEQKKIASVLSSADKEIETHQKQLSAVKQQKKGLMQQLLTGKKRVKLDESEQLTAVGA